MQGEKDDLYPWVELREKSFGFLHQLLNFSFVVENKETLKHLASLYANNHPSMHMGQPSCPNKSGKYFPYHLLLFLLWPYGLVDSISLNAFVDENIPGGVMRGAEWHSHLGSMKVYLIECSKNGITNIGHCLFSYKQSEWHLLHDFLDKISLNLTSNRILIFCHFNHFWLYNSVILITFTMLCIHHHSKPSISKTFSSPQTETL